jgi:signal transduction histidine kinase
MQAATRLETDSTVSLESILCTGELARRSVRPPDYQTENRALVALAQALADSPESILQKLADTILEVFQADSAGISLLSEGGKTFYWPAIAGAWKPHVGGGTPRHFGPCGDVLDRNCPLLFKHFERRYPYLQEAAPLAEEALLLPFHVRGKAVGTIWAMAHDGCRKFDAEDLRQMESLSRFASSAYQAVQVEQLQESRRAALESMEDAVQSRLAVEKLNVELRENIAEQKRAEARLQSLNQDLQHFIYAASHDLQQPLRMVISYTQLLARRYKGKIDERADKYIAYAVEGAQQMEMLLNDLREYWSVNGQKAGQPVAVDCNHALEKALDLLESAVEESDGEIVHDPLPTVQAEEVPMVLLFQNLIGNALKYHRPNEPPYVRISAERDSHLWTISVSDSGIGIEAEHLKDIFAPFKRLHGSEYRGSGLGLALCLRIVDRYGGNIWAESEYGRGTTFRFTVPA